MKQLLDLCSDHQDKIDKSRIELFTELQVELNNYMNIYNLEGAVTNLNLFIRFGRVEGITFNIGKEEFFFQLWQSTVKDLSNTNKMVPDDEIIVKYYLYRMVEEECYKFVDGAFSEFRSTMTPRP